MKHRSFAWGVACLIVGISGISAAQPLTPVVDITPHAAAAASPLAGILPPNDVIANVRSAGFEPLSRPTRRGAVYVLFAADPHDADMRVVVDAHSGRVLSATPPAREIYDDPGEEGYEVPPRAVPPGYASPHPHERPLRLQPPEGRTMAQAATGLPADGGGLAASEIVARVRSAGFDPLSRPVQRGGVYVLFAVDRQYMDVRVIVDANSGRMLSVTRLAGMRFGGPGYEGYDELSRVYERPPVPPGDIPNRGIGRTGAATSTPPHLPLPRARPGDVVTGAVKDTGPPARTEPRATAPPAGLGDTIVETSPPTAPPQPPQPTMVPIAPLN